MIRVGHAWIKYSDTVLKQLDTITYTLGFGSVFSVHTLNTLAAIDGGLTS